MQRGHLRQDDRLKKKELRIGFQILLSGLWPPDWGPEYGEAAEKIPWPEQKETGYIRIKRKDFSKYITDELSSLISMWHRIKRYGWPQGKGYLAEPRTVFEVVELFDGESERYGQFAKEGER